MEHKATKAKLADKNKIYQSIEEAKSGALKGERERGQMFGKCDFRMDGSINGVIKVS